MTTEEPVSRQVPATDEALLADLVAGQPESVGLLYARYAPRIFAAAARALDRPTAEEVVQDVFLTVWRNASSFDPARGPVRPWLLQIARFRIANELRQRGRRPRTGTESDDLALEMLADPSPGPAEAAWEDFRRSVLAAALVELPAAQRQALGLAFFEELTHEEVASVLRLPLGTAKSRIRVGLSSLRTKLAPLFAVLVFCALLAGAAIAFRRAHRELTRGERALTMLTSSDSETLRLTAQAGVATETHATYRMRPGGEVAVLTLSKFPATPAGRTCQAWAYIGGRWIPAGLAVPGADGRAMIIAEGPAFGRAPDALQVTLEPEGGSASPHGPPLVAWRR